MKNRLTSSITIDGPLPFRLPENEITFTLYNVTEITLTWKESLRSLFGKKITTKLEIELHENGSVIDSKANTTVDKLINRKDKIYQSATMNFHHPRIRDKRYIAK